MTPAEAVAALLRSLGYDERPPLNSITLTALGPDTLEVVVDLNVQEPTEVRRISHHVVQA